MSRLISDLENVIAFWKNDLLGIDPLIRVKYTCVIAKSHRIVRLFSVRGESLNSHIVGAEYSNDKTPKHIITYSLPLKALEKALLELTEALEIVVNGFDGVVSADDVVAVNSGKKSIPTDVLSKSSFTKIIRDTYYVKGFEVKESGDSADGDQLVTVYNTGLPYQELLSRIGGGFRPADKLDDLTWLLSPDQYGLINEKFPYLVSMKLPDLNKYERFEGEKPHVGGLEIPEPGDEPVIGVIDTLFDQSVYFSAWVEYHQMLDNALMERNDYDHGTEVSSIIVDGPRLNDVLDDGCGRFRVRHFGVAKERGMSSLVIIRSVRQIVISNPDIKVWNLSLGSDFPVSENFISPEAAVLDELQYERDVIFVVSGTNNRRGDDTYPRIGAPADSINAMTVNSVDYSGKYVSYSRRGPVLEFFNKPDVSVFGGTTLDRMQAYGPNGIVKVFGTSFAAPWITRKLAYLIHIMGLTKEAAKALLIDSAIGWNTNVRDIALIGYGIVPRRIEDIIKCRDDEIRFFISGNVLDYETYTNDIPVPYSKGGFPYRFKVTMCYTPRCHRNQGVDYTDTELDIHFGRYGKNGKFQSINKNQQGDPVFINLPEDSARKTYRKWDNVKHVSEGFTGRVSSKKMRNEKDIYWAFSIKTVERLDDKPGRGMPYSAVITMRATDGQNRIGQFIKLCNITHTWSVIPLNQEVMTDIYHRAEKEIEFEE